jgi:hypothetical protein
VDDLPILRISYLSDTVFTLICSSGMESDTQATARPYRLKNKFNKDMVARK